MILNIVIVLYYLTLTALCSSIITGFEHSDKVKHIEINRLNKSKLPEISILFYLDSNVTTFSVSKLNYIIIILRCNFELWISYTLAYNVLENVLNEYVKIHIILFDFLNNNEKNLKHVPGIIWLPILRYVQSSNLCLSNSASQLHRCWNPLTAVKHAITRMAIIRIFIMYAIFFPGHMISKILDLYVA